MTAKELLETIVCPVCGGASNSLCPARDWGEMRSCVNCGLIFAQPMALPMPANELYGGAYSGRVTVCDMADFEERLMLANSIFRTPMPKLALWSPAYRDSLNFIKERLGKGARVLDIGCGTGVFLKSLRAAGFEAVGCDVAGPAVEFLRRQGFAVYHGSIDECSFDDPKPAAITCFFALHHISDPIGFLSTIRSKFPQSILIISEYYGSRFNCRSPRSLPPRTLSFWTPEALKLALEKAGYSNVRSMSTKFAASDITVRYARRIYVRVHNVTPSFLLPLYFLAKKIVFWPTVRYRRVKGMTRAVLAIAEP